MNIDDVIMADNHYYKLSKNMFKMLNCNSLWVMNIDNKNLLTMLVTDKSILEHYWAKKYYLQDPNIESTLNDIKESWDITLGSDCEAFSKNGFLYDLYKIFHVEEFVSIEKRMDKGRYCFRFFTKNNRFVFMNKLVNDMPIIKYFINAMTENYKAALHHQPGIEISALKEGGLC